MAKLEIDGKVMQVKDGDGIMKACQAEGVPFGCHHGACGICEIEVVEGMENLSPINEEEKLLGITKPFRLACQCKITHGLVKIKF